mmetsp:Transcript_95225/g.204422  ORF Transcript_95225/g.204422 Transcript_95225/m.204422 type:complete len:284 (+) Transcript_95225:596-1447(+)
MNVTVFSHEFVSSPFTPKCPVCADVAGMAVVFNGDPPEGPTPSDIAGLLRTRYALHAKIPTAFLYWAFTSSASWPVVLETAKQKSEGKSPAFLEVLVAFIRTRGADVVGAMVVAGITAAVVAAAAVVATRSALAAAAAAAAALAAALAERASLRTEASCSLSSATSDLSSATSPLLARSTTATFSASSPCARPATFASALHGSLPTKICPPSFATRGRQGSASLLWSASLSTGSTCAKSCDEKSALTFPVCAAPRPDCRRHIVSSGSSTTQASSAEHRSPSAT